jgi:hypothetical protein
MSNRIRLDLNQEELKVLDMCLYFSYHERMGLRDNQGVILLKLAKKIRNKYSSWQAHKGEHCFTEWWNEFDSKAL